MVTVALMVAGVEGFRRYDRARKVSACDAAGATIEAVWNAEARSRVREGLLATGVSYAPVTAEKVMPWLDDQAQAWREHTTQACMNTEVHETWDADTLDRAVWCLDERRLELASLVTELGRADAQVVQKSVSAAASLAPASPCLDATVLANLPLPPAQDARAAIAEVRAELSHARTLLAAGKYTAGLDVARTAQGQAGPLGWPPLLAAADLLVGVLLEKSGSFAEAEAALLRAYVEAAKASAWDVAASAAMILVSTVGVAQVRRAEGRTWASHAEVAATHAGDPLGLREAGRANNLGSIHLAAGDYTEAKALCERTLVAREKALGPDHPDVAMSLDNLANVDMATGAHDEAKALHERALDIREKALGPDHPDVATSLNNLANVHYATGEYAEARTLHERALAILERALGLDHPDVASSLGNLGSVYMATGEHAQARTLHERALAIREKALGPDHPDLATSLTNLAGVHFATGEYAQAGALQERALAIQEKPFGPDHPDVATSLDNLGVMHAAVGEFTRARALYERALAIKEKALGPDHPDVASSLHNLALVHYAAGEYAQARTLNERALAIFEKAFGPDHPDVAGSLNSLASVHVAIGEYGEAKALYERALAIWQTTLGPEHADLAYPLVGLAQVALAQSRSQDAVPLAERAVRAREQGEAPAELLALARFVLARALWEAPVSRGRDRARATRLARAARDAFRSAKGFEDGLAEVESWLAAHTPP